MSKKRLVAVVPASFSADEGGWGFSLLPPEGFSEDELSNMIGTMSSDDCATLYFIEGKET